MRHSESPKLLSNKAGTAFSAVTVALLLLFVLAPMAANTWICIDTDDIINKQSVFYYGWLGISRYGLVLTKWLFGLLSIVPPLQTMLMVVTTIVAAFSWGLLYAWLRSEPVNALGFVLPALLFLSAPYLENVNFQCQNFEIAFAFVLSALSFWCQWNFIELRRPTYALGAVVLAAWSFASYQAFVPFYLCAASLTFCVRLCSRSQNQGEAVSHPFRTILTLAAFFLLALAVFYAADKLVLALSGLPSGAYTSNQVILGKEPLVDVLRSFKAYLKQIFLQQGYAWDWMYLVSYAALLFAYPALVLGRVWRGGSSPVWLCLAIPFAAVVPFLLPFALGGGAIRAQFALPLVMAFSLQMTLDELRVRLDSVDGPAPLKIAAVAICLLLVVGVDVVRDARLVYTNNMVKQQEYVLSLSLQQEIAAVGGSTGDVVAFVGAWHPTMNASMEAGEVLGRSFFEWDTEVAGGTTRRILSLWETLGYVYTNPSAEQLAQAESLAETMPTYPAEGSVVMSGEMIVVKLS